MRGWLRILVQVLVILALCGLVYWLLAGHRGSERVPLDYPSARNCMRVPLSPIQVRMARAALQMTTRALGDAIGVSAMAISRYERGDLGVMSLDTLETLSVYCTERRLYFGPKDGICVGSNVFKDERWLGLACYQLLLEQGCAPNSQMLLEAYERFQDKETPREE